VPKTIRSCRVEVNVCPSPSVADDQYDRRVSHSLVDLILAEASDDWVPIGAADGLARSLHPWANEAELASLLDATIRSLLDEQLAQIGHLLEADPHFQAWSGTTDQQLARLQQELANAGDGWIFAMWFSATIPGIERGERFVQENPQRYEG
jgi:hypothetical protein